MKLSLMREKRLKLRVRRLQMSTRELGNKSSEVGAVGGGAGGGSGGLINTDQKTGIIYENSILKNNFVDETLQDIYERHILRNYDATVTLPIGDAYIDA